VPLTVEYKNISKEQEAKLSERHVAMGTAILNGNTESYENNFEGEKQCLKDAFEKLCETGILLGTYTE